MVSAALLANITRVDPVLVVVVVATVAPALARVMVNWSVLNGRPPMPEHWNWWSRLRHN